MFTLGRYSVPTMIKVLQEGIYQLIETKNQTKILILDNKNTFAWIYVRSIGEILVTSHKSHKADSVVAMGRYRLYEVKDEPKITDLIHLELLVGAGIWQGYVLPNGFPTDADKRNRIIPTKEIITKSSH
jgi:hypothetical protein